MKNSVIGLPDMWPWNSYVLHAYKCKYLCVITGEKIPEFTPPTAPVWLRNLTSLSEPATNSRRSEDRPVLCNGSVDPSQDPIYLYCSSEFTYTPPLVAHKHSLSLDMKLFTFTLHKILLNVDSFCWTLPALHGERHLLLVCKHDHHICLSYNLFFSLVRDEIALIGLRCKHATDLEQPNWFSSHHIQCNIVRWWLIDIMAV